MANTKSDLPQTISSPQTGETLYRDIRPFTVRYKGHNKIVQLPGYYSQSGDEGVHVGDDMKLG